MQQKSGLGKFFNSLKKSPILAFAIISGLLAITVPAINSIIGDQNSSSATKVCSFGPLECYVKKGFVKFEGETCPASTAVAKNEFNNILGRIGHKINLNQPSSSPLKHSEFAIMVLRYQNENWFNEVKNKPEYEKGKTGFNNTYDEARIALYLLKKYGILSTGAQPSPDSTISYYSMATMLNTIQTSSNNKFFAKLKTDLNKGKSCDFVSDTKRDKVEEPKGEATCKDLNNIYIEYREVMNYFNKKKWLVGDDDGNCKPFRSIRRNSIALVLNRMNGHPSSKYSSYQVEVINALNNSRNYGVSKYLLIEGDNTLGEGTITREEFAELAYDYIKNNDYKATENSKLNKGSFKDTDNKAADYLFKQGVMIGDADCKFHPKRELNRAEFTTTMYRILFKGNRQRSFHCDKAKTEKTTWA